jgi:16S rRNA G527 N7-methylase RsmG
VFADALTCRLAGIVDLSAEQLSVLEGHYQMLLRWNRSVNLTSISGLEEAVERHYCESLAVLRPDCSVTLVESHQRKAVFLREVSRTLPSVRVLSKRAEAVGEQFDRVISRAVSYRDLTTSLKVLAESADLLTGAEEPPPELGFYWVPAMALPWGKQRFLRTGRRL